MLVMLKGLGDDVDPQNGQLHNATPANYQIQQAYDSLITLSEALRLERHRTDLASKCQDSNPMDFLKRKYITIC